MKDDIKIIAVVKFNDGEAYVLNRLPDFKYTRIGTDHLHAQDGPFHKVFKLKHDRFAKAFAGREFYLPLKDGGQVHCKGQWWDDGQGYVGNQLGLKFEHVTFSTINQLVECYVYTGADGEADKLSELRAAYTGQVYEYRDYEKIIKYQPERSRLWAEIRELEQQNESLRNQSAKQLQWMENRVNALIKEVKKKHSMLNPRSSGGIGLRARMAQVHLFGVAI